MREDLTVLAASAVVALVMVLVVLAAVLKMLMVLEVLVVLAALDAEKTVMGDEESKVALEVAIRACLIRLINRLWLWFFDRGHPFFVLS